MTFAATVLTLYPEMFPGPLGVSLAGRVGVRKIERFREWLHEELAADRERLPGEIWESGQ